MNPHAFLVRLTLTHTSSLRLTILKMAGPSKPHKRDFDPDAALEKAKLLQAANRKVRHRTSMLDRYVYEILEIRKRGATPRQVQLMIEHEFRKRIALSTVCRWLQKHENTPVRSQPICATDRVPGTS